MTIYVRDMLPNLVDFVDRVTDKHTNKKTVNDNGQVSGDIIHAPKIFSQ